MIQDNTTKRRGYLRALPMGLLILAGPPILLALMLTVRFGSKVLGLDVSYIEIGLALIPGLAGIWLLTLPPTNKVLMLIFYIPAMSFGLCIWGLLFMCGAFGACL
ncbi:hypothetical protein [Sphingomonas sp. PAMC 26617]|uniref:hypothetical protein n=1 Tax=Sphingomonas sp. PAMC 26617 TaxID=1112216 RepID=UPI0002880ABB|nr:hypothetical protein [Sphingomonas sp. PAMC 26617]